MKGAILTYILAYGGAAVALFEPPVGMIVYAIFATTYPQILFGWAANLSGMSLVVGAATLVGWLFKGFGSWQFGRGSLQVKLLLAFFVWTCVSALGATNQAVAWAYVIERAKIVLMFLVGMTLIDSERWVRRLAWSLVIAQGYVGFEMNLSYLQGFNRAQEQGLLGDNNSFAISMVTMIGPAMFLGLAERAWWKKAIAFGCAALILHTVLLTFSRGGILSLIVTGLAVLVVMPKRPSLILGVIAASLLTVRLMGPQVTDRFMTTFAPSEERDASAESRLELWTDCVTVMMRHPITGLGPSHFPIDAPQFGWPAGKSAHSLWFQSGAELGIPAVLCLMGFYVWTIWRAASLARRGASDPRSVYGLYVFSGLIGFVVSAQFVSIEGLEVPYFIVLIGAATLKLSSTDADIDGAPALAGFESVPAHGLATGSRGAIG